MQTSAFGRGLIWPLDLKEEESHVDTKGCARYQESHDPDI